MNRAPPQTARAFGRRARFACGGLLAAWACLLYHGALSTPFFFDDLASIVNNPQVRRLWPLSDAMTPPPDLPTSNRPLVALSFAIDYALGGLRVEGYHAVNLALHAINTALLFSLVALLLRNPQLPAPTRAAALPLAAASAWLWSAHPLLSESVVYVTQRTELMAATLYLSALLCAAHAFMTPGRRIWEVLAVAAALLGIGCKETDVTIAVAVLCLDRLAYTPSLRHALRARPVLYAGLGLQLCVGAAMTLAAPYHEAGVGFSDGISPPQWLATQAGVLVLYLQRMVWPEPLSISYQFPIAQQLLRYAPQFVLLSALLLGSLGLAARAGIAAFPALLFFIHLAPSSSFVPLSTEVVAERRMYVPAATLIVYAVVLGHLALLRLRLTPKARRLAAIALVGAAACALSAKTLARVRDYASPERIWGAAVAADPNDPQAVLGLAIVLQRQGRNAEARALASKLRGWPREFAGARDWAGRAEVIMGMCDEAQGELASALSHYEAVASSSPASKAALVDAARVLMRLGRAAEAVPRLQHALSLGAAKARDHHNLGVALSWVGRHAEASDQFARAFALDPSSPESLEALASSLRAQGRLAEAERVLRELVRRWPQRAKAQAMLSQVSRQLAGD